MNTTTTASAYKGHRFPPQIISHAVWLYHRFSLSYRDVEDLLSERGIVVTYETVRQWCLKFGQQYANQLLRRRARPGEAQRAPRHCDEVFLTIKGKTFYLWRAVDQHGTVLDILVQSRRNKAAAKKFFTRKRVLELPKGCTYVPRVLITDKLGSYQAAKQDVMPNVEHRKHKRLNNRAENSHQPTRQRERMMRRFKAAGHAQRFLSAFTQGVPANPGALLSTTSSTTSGGVPSGTYASIPGLERGKQPADGYIAKKRTRRLLPSSPIDHRSLP